jgi:hypothetical protein
VIQQTIRAERSRRHLITLGTWPTPFVAFASSTKPGQSPGRAGNRTPSAGRSPTDETGIPRPCGHGTDRRHRGDDIRTAVTAGADIRDPDLGKGGAALTAQPLTAQPLTEMRGPEGTTGAAAVAGLPATPGAAPRAMPTPCPPTGTKIKSPCNSVRAPPLGWATILWFEGAVSGHRRTSGLHERVISAWSFRTSDIALHCG